MGLERSQPGGGGEHNVIPTCKSGVGNCVTWLEFSPACWAEKEHSQHLLLIVMVLSLSRPAP
eukprot:14803311-Ditylum_brightwellii.AAC.1